MDTPAIARAGEGSRGIAGPQQLPAGVLTAAIQVQTTDAALMMHVNVAVGLREEPALLPDVPQSQPLLTVAGSPAVHGDGAAVVRSATEYAPLQPPLQTATPQEQQQRPQQQQQAGQEESGGAGGQRQEHQQGDEQQAGGATAPPNAVRPMAAVPPTQVLALVPTVRSPASAAVEGEGGHFVVAKMMASGLGPPPEGQDGAPETGPLLPPTMPNTVPQSVAPASAAIDSEGRGGGGGGGGGGGAGAGGGKLVSPGSVRGPKRQLGGTGGDAVGLLTRGAEGVVVGGEPPQRDGDAVSGDRGREGVMGGREAARALGAALDRAAAGAPVQQQQGQRQEEEQQEEQQEEPQEEEQQQEEQLLLQPQGGETEKQKGEGAEGGGLGTGSGAGGGVASEGRDLRGSHAAAHAEPAEQQHGTSGQPDRQQQQRQQPTGPCEQPQPQPSSGGNEQSGSGMAADGKHVSALAAHSEPIDVQLEVAPAAEPAGAVPQGGACAMGTDTGDTEAADALTHGSAGDAGGAVPASADTLQPHVAVGAEGGEVLLVASLAQGMGVAPAAQSQPQPTDGVPEPSGGGMGQQAAQGAARDSGMGELSAGQEVQAGGFEFVALGERGSGRLGEELEQEQEGTKAAAEAAGDGGPVVMGKGAAEAGRPSRLVQDSMDPERLPGAKGPRVEGRARSKKSAGTTGAGQGVGDTDAGMEREAALPGAGEAVLDQAQPQPRPPAPQGMAASAAESKPSPLQRKSLFGFLRGALQRDARAAAATPARAAASAGERALDAAAATPDAEQQQQQQQAGPSRQQARDANRPRSGGGGGGGGGGMLAARVAAAQGRSPRQQPPRAAPASAAPAATTTTSVTTRSGGRGAGGDSPLVVAATTTTTIGTEAASVDRTPRSAERRAGESSAQVVTHRGGTGGSQSVLYGVR